MTLACALLCSLTAARAQEKVWKHGILEAKSDAGFIAMVDKGGFAAKRGLKAELLQIKAGTTLMKALISGEIDSVDMGAAESIIAGISGLAERRDDLVKFVAEMEAYKYAATHRDATVKIAHEMTNAKPDDTRAGFIYDEAIREKADRSVALDAGTVRQGRRRAEGRADGLAD